MYDQSLYVQRAAQDRLAENQRYVEQRQALRLLREARQGHGNRLASWFTSLTARLRAKTPAEAPSLRPAPLP